MSFELNDYIRVRPYLYHLTSRQNAARIRRIRRLESASALMHSAGNASAVSHRRRHHLVVHVEGEAVHIRDQAPLHAGNVRFDGGWSIADLIRALNERVFFWPGTASGPISYGVRHFERYKDEQPVVIRVSAEELFGLNADSTPLFCKYNSGSPRCSGGIGSPRGPATFVAAAAAGFRPPQCVEVTFAGGGVLLPPQALTSGAPTGPWTPLFD